MIGLFASSSRAQTCPPPSTPCAADQDCDLIPDTYELSTVDGNNQTLDLDLTCSDALLEFDGDGLSNLAEYQNANALFSFRDKLICGPDSAPTSECHPIIESFTLDKTSVLETGEVIVSWTTLHTVGAGRQLRVEPFGIIPSAEAALGNRTLTVSASTFFTMYASNENATRAEYREVEVFTESQTNTYNAANQRVRQVVGGTERLFVYGPDGQILAETTASGAPIVENIYLEGEPLAQIHGSGSASKTYYVHASHLGTPELLTDSNQAVVWAIETGPFGEQHSEGVFGSNVTQSTRFPGQIYDAGTQVSYNWHRYYDPSIGRYISADPIGQAGGINVYTYAANNPVFWIDPDGLDIAVIENGPTEGNLIGHTAVAVTGSGVYSSGNGVAPGSSLAAYLDREASRRDTTVTVIPTTPDQDKAAVDYLRDNTNEAPGFFTDNCSNRSNNALDAAKVPQTAYPDSLPGSAGDRAAKAGGTQVTVPKSAAPRTPTPSLGQFEP